MKKRCLWVSDDPLYQKYHDEEWGVPVHDDRKLFEFLILEGAQAGLSWITILKRREGYYKCFYNFDIDRIARMSDEELDQILKDPAVIRNRRKIYGTRTNARAFQDVQREYGSFGTYLWSLVDHAQIQNSWKKFSDVPITTRHSDILSKDLKKRGFIFVGSTIMYAYMQAIGMVNDHTTDCFRWKELQ
jgi:DNA-3-methyladenine glycosylase I